MERCQLSIESSFAGRAVLLTGGLGFLGSCVLEHLLRKTEVGAVYLLVRGKRQQTAADRVHKLLSSPLFHLLHKQAAAGGRNVFAKVIAVDGDLCAPGLGLAEADADMLRVSVDYVIHCAANMTLDADIQRTLRDNYFSTKALMAFASQIRHLRAFLHTSTYFVNNYQQRKSLVMEKIYPLPLQLEGRAVKHQEFTSAVMEMDPAAANQAVAGIMQSHNFTSTYAFAKHLTEQLVTSTSIGPGVAKAIVRPSLISAIAGAPYPGWVSGYAGAPGYVMGYAFGFLQAPQGIAYAGDMLVDLIPCDTVAMMIIAATAAAADSSRHNPNVETQPAQIYHACSTESHPYKLPDVINSLHTFWSHNSAPLTLPATRYVRMEPSYKPTAVAVTLVNLLARWKVLLLSYYLKLMGYSKRSNLLLKSFEAFNVQNSFAYDRSIVCSVDNGRALLAALPAAERAAWPIIWEPQQMSWDMYFCTFQAGVRGLLFKMGPEVRGVEHMFVSRKPADVTDLVLVQQISDSSEDLQCSSSTSRSSSSSSLSDRVSAASISSTVSAGTEV